MVDVKQNNDLASEIDEQFSGEDLLQLYLQSSKTGAKRGATLPAPRKTYNAERPVHRLVATISIPIFLLLVPLILCVAALMFAALNTRVTPMGQEQTEIRPKVTQNGQESKPKGKIFVLGLDNALITKNARGHAPSESGHLSAVSPERPLTERAQVSEEQRVLEDAIRTNPEFRKQWEQYIRQFLTAQASNQQPPAPPKIPGINGSDQIRSSPEFDVDPLDELVDEPDGASEQ